ncbi:MAG: hypothetical protein KGJ87_10385 [Planctomycetota bacterium]|nr:hypothetical protein [Planctomycetota bacterium]MDE2217548.1 hypothetical protein [Planctomycetota bacterium]
MAQKGGQGVESKKVSQEVIEPRFKALKRLVRRSGDTESQHLYRGFYPYGVAFDGTNIWVANMALVK